MVQYLFEVFLSGLRKIAVLIQIGNPFGKAPNLISSPSDREKLDMKIQGTDPISVWQLQDVICSGLYGGAVINNKNQVYSRFLSFPWGNALHLCLISPFLGRKLPSIEKAIFLITPEAKGNYYHWIIDLLPRLLLIKKCGLNDLKERQIILHHPSKRYEINSLEALGVNNVNIVRLREFEYCPVKDLIVADYVNNQGTFPQWKKLLLDEFKHDNLSLSNNISPKKIYLMRGNQKKRCLIGEEKLIRRLKEAGFEIFDPQQMSLIDQINLLAVADLVIGLHGAALTNIVFCKENTLIIELRSDKNAPEFYSEIARAFKLNFETLSLPAERIYKKKHHSNKQNLVMNEKHIQILMSKL